MTYKTSSWNWALTGRPAICGTHPRRVQALSQLLVPDLRGHSSGLQQSPAALPTLGLQADPYRALTTFSIH